MASNLNSTGGHIASGTGPPNRLIGMDGDFYIDAHNSLLYGPKHNGTWPRPAFSLKGLPGPVGNKGEEGESGKRGSRLTIGTGEPTDENGELGDYYIQKNEKDEIALLYGPKTETGWEPGVPFAITDINTFSAFKTIAPTNRGELVANATFEPIPTFIKPIMISANGEKQVIAMNIDNNYAIGDLYESYDAGNTFNKMDYDFSGRNGYMSAAMSADGGNKMICILREWTNTNKYDIISSISYSTTTYIKRTITGGYNIANVAFLIYLGLPAYSFIKYDVNYKGYVDIIELDWMYLPNGNKFYRDITDLIYTYHMIAIKDYNASPDMETIFLLVLVSSYELILLKSTDVGLSWTSLIVDIIDYEYEYAFISSSNQGDVLITTRHFLYISRNGDPFVKIAPSDIGPTYSEFYHISYMSHDGNYIFVSIRGMIPNYRRINICYSADAGVTWHIYYTSKPESDSYGFSYIVSGNTNRMLLYDYNLYNLPLVKSGSGLFPPPINLVPVTAGIDSGTDCLMVWTNVVMSKDGQYRVASNQFREIYVSYDYGDNWSRSYSLIASSYRSQILMDMDNSGKYTVFGFLYENLVYYNDNYGHPSAWQIIPVVINGNNLFALHDIAIRKNVSTINNNIMLVIAAEGIMNPDSPEENQGVIGMTYGKSFFYMTVFPIMNINNRIEMDINDDATFITCSSGTNIYLSANSGTTFSMITPSTNSEVKFMQVSMSESGHNQLVGGDELLRITYNVLTGHFDYQIINLIPSLNTAKTSIKVSSDGDHQFFSIRDSNGAINIYKSTDSGNTWKIEYFLQNYYNVANLINHIAVSQNLDYIVFVSNSLINIYQGYGQYNLGIMNSVVPFKDVSCDIGRYDKTYNNLYTSTLFVSSGASLVSDNRLKEDVQDLSIGSDFIKSIRPVEYRYRQMPDKIHYGVIAQEVGDALRKSGMNASETSVYNDNGDHLSIAYSELIAPLIKTTQELYDKYEKNQRTIEDFKRRIEVLKQK